MPFETWSEIFNLAITDLIDHDEVIVGVDPMG
jgi:hypothetical protein